MMVLHGDVSLLKFRLLLHHLYGIPNDRSIESTVFPVYSCDVLCRVSGVIIDNHIGRIIIFIPYDTHIKVGRDMFSWLVVGENVLYVLRFVQICCNRGGCDSYIIFRINEEIILVYFLIKYFAMFID